MRDIIMNIISILVFATSIHWGFGDLTDARITCAQHQLNYVNKTDMFNNIVICSDSDNNLSAYKF